MIVLELLHLKMEVIVSEPCDVIRIHNYHVYAQFYMETLKCKLNKIGYVEKEPNDHQNNEMFARLLILKIC